MSISGILVILVVIAIIFYEISNAKKGNSGEYPT